MKIRKIAVCLTYVVMGLFSAAAFADSPLTEKAKTDYCCCKSSSPLSRFAKGLVVPEVGSTCMLVKNSLGAATPLQITWENAGSTTTHDKITIGRLCNQALSTPTEKVTIKNLKTNVEIFNGTLNNYTGLICNDTQCSPWDGQSAATMPAAPLAAAPMPATAPATVLPPAPRRIIDLIDEPT